MPEALSIDRYQALIGQPVGSSAWFLIDQKRIDAFADATEDWQYIHTDPESAASGPFGGTIAHGYLTLAMLSAMVYSAVPPVAGSSMSMNYGMNRLRFLKPVPSGSRICGHFLLKQLSERSPGHWQSTFDVTVEIEGIEGPALAAEWVTLNVVG